MSERETTGWLADRLSGARADAERIARELADRGHLTPAQVATIAAAVDGAVERGRELIADALREPRRVLASLRAQTPAAAATGTAGGGPSESPEADATARTRDVGARLDAIEERLSVLEDRLPYGRVRRGSESD